jgi:hypothetical protein
MKGKLHKMESGYILSLNGDIDDPYAIVNKELAEDYEWYKLSKQNCDEIFGIVDVDKLAYDSSQEYLIKPIESPIFTFGYEQGFNKAMELNKDKLFTLEDVKFRVETVKEQLRKDVDSYGKPKKIMSTLDSIFQSLQQPTEIEVEIEMEYYDPLPPTRQTALRPKLDENGCLILKRI